MRGGKFTQRSYGQGFTIEGPPLSEDAIKRREALRKKVIPGQDDARFDCDGCNGDGLWKMGPITNGVPARTGTCFRCKGKGKQSAKDRKRNAYYDNHRTINPNA